MESLSPTWAPATTYAVCMNLTSFGRSGVQNVSASLIASRDLAGCGSWKKLQFLARCKAHAEPCVDEVPEHRNDEWKVRDEIVPQRSDGWVGLVVWVDGVELTRGFYGIDVACRERMDEVTKLVVGDPGEAGSVRIVIRQEYSSCLR